MRPEKKNKRLAFLIVSLLLLLTAAAGFAVFSLLSLRAESVPPAISGQAVMGIGELESEVIERSNQISQDFETFEATAYCDAGITFSGIPVRPGIVAGDPEILPIGSVIEVKAGDYSGVYTVMDTGGRIKGEIIDIFMPDYEEAVQFGRQKIKIRILRYGWEPSLLDSYTSSLAG